MINGLSIGAPPDLLNAHGQSWGLGAFDPRAMKLNGFRAYIEMLRAAFANAGGVRIDHVLGLARMWLVPAGASPKEGAYLRYPLDDLLRLIALESWRHRAIVIGEDLGTVPEGFGERLARAGVLGIRVLWFQRDKAHFLAPAAWSADAIATTTTHDLPTFAGWWEGRDIGWRTRLDLLEEDATEMGERDAREQDRAMLWKAFTEAGCARGAAPPADMEHAPADEAIAFLAATPAPLAILPIEDALGLPEQWNIPGTTDSHPNWRRRLRQPVEDLLDESAVAARLAILDGARRSTGAQQ
jgi:4-alpha-glucanotransferase